MAVLRQDIIKHLLYSVSTVLIFGCSDTDRRGVSPDGAANEPPVVSVSSVEDSESYMSGEFLDKEISTFEETFKIYDQKVKPFKNKSNLSDLETKKIIDSHKIALDAVVKEVVDKEEKGYQQVLDRWKKVSIKGDLKIARDRQYPWDGLQQLGVELNYFENFVSFSTEIQNAQKHAEGLENPFNPQFAQSGLQEVLMQQSKDTMMDVQLPALAEYKKVLAWPATLNEHGEEIADSTAMEQRPTGSYSERPKNINLMLDQAVDARVEMLIGKKGQLTPFGSELTEKVISNYEQRGFYLTELRGSTSSSIESHLLGEITNVLKTAIRGRPDGADLLVSNKPLVCVSKKVFDKVGLDLLESPADEASNPTHHTWEDGECVSLEFGASKVHLSLRKWGDGVLSKKPVELQDLSIQNYVKLRSEALKVYVSTLGSEKEFYGLFNYLLKVEGFKDDPTLITILQKHELNNAHSLEFIGDLTKGSLRAARRGVSGIDVSAFRLNGQRSEKVIFNVPLFVKLDGFVESEKSINATGIVATKLGNTIVGISYAYANDGVGFLSNSFQSETSIIASHSFGALFIEAQFGAVNAENVKKSDFSGNRTQITLGFDTTHISPFVQVLHRSFERGGLVRSQALDTMVSLAIDMALVNYAADTYTIDTYLTAKAGFAREVMTGPDLNLGNSSKFNGSLEFSGTLSLNSGVSFSTNLEFGRVNASGASLNMSLSR